MRTLLYPPINAYVEKVAYGKFFRTVWTNRAVIPVDDWFEWVDEGGPNKQPYLFRRRDRAPVLCAAIGQYRSAGTEPLETEGFVIITADSAGGIVDLHDRRPVVLLQELATPKERAEQMVITPR